MSEQASLGAEPFEREELLACARESTWRRIVWPHSYNPATGLTTVRWFWHPIHAVSAFNRAKWRWWAWQQRNS